MDGSLPARAVSPGRPVCGVSACAAGRSSSLLVPPSPAGAPNNRGGGCLVSGLQHPCWQVCTFSTSATLLSRFLMVSIYPVGLTSVCIVFFSEAALLRIMQILASAAAKAHGRETCATFIKFSSSETMHVSRHPGLKNASALLGV